jgi:hypothetical protein
MKAIFVSIGFLLFTSILIAQENYHIELMLGGVSRGELINNNTNGVLGQNNAFETYSKADKRNKESEFAYDSLKNYYSFSKSGYFVRDGFIYSKNKVYPIVNIYPTTVASSINLLKISTIRLIDLRPDPKKTGYVPINSILKNSELEIVGLNINQSPLNWFKNWLETIPRSNDTTINRQLILVLRDCWFSQDAFVHRHSANNSLITTLNYHIELFTQIDNNYYPIKKLNGEFSIPFEKGKAYQHLLDSLQQLIEKQGINLVDEKIETNKLKIDPTSFNAYLNEIKSKNTFALNPAKGVYENFEKFIEQAPFADSAILIKSHTMNDRIPSYAIEIQPIIDGMEKNSYGIWGYFDGKDLFYNTGNGLFIKLIKDGQNGYCFPYLNLISRDNIKSTLLSNVKFGKSDYSIIKEYSRISPLTYKLNLSNGKLY